VKVWCLNEWNEPLGADTVGGVPECHGWGSRLRRRGGTPAKLEKGRALREGNSLLQRGQRKIAGCFEPEAEARGRLPPLNWGLSYS